MASTTNDQREIRRKLRILERAQACGEVSRTCRYFGVGRASLYRGPRLVSLGANRAGEQAVRATQPFQQDPWGGRGKVLHLRSKYHLGPMRIIRYLAR